MYRYWFWLLLLVAEPVWVSAQRGFNFVSERKQIDIPFEYVNHFIILNIQFDRKLPLKFILDTGAEHTILTKREITDLLGKRYERQFRIMGSDLSEELSAYLVRNVQLELPNKAVAVSEDILVLNEDYFHFEEFSGISIHGILSASLFANYILKINYDKCLLTLYKREHFKPHVNDYLELPMEIYKNKPYVETSLKLLNDSTASVKLLLDTGAGLPLLLFSNTHPMLKPPPNALASNIAMGLGGYLLGSTGRIFSLELGDYQQGNIVTYFQQLDTTFGLKSLNGRNGLVGNMLLNRFTVVLDYTQSKIWLRPGRLYRERFEFDRSGVNLMAYGEGHRQFIVQFVLPNTPAAEAGLQQGDIIKKVGIRPTNLLDLGHVQQMFRKKPGTRIKLTVQRGKTIIRTAIILRDLI